MGNWCCFLHQAKIAIIELPTPYYYDLSCSRLPCFPSRLKQATQPRMHKTPMYIDFSTISTVVNYGSQISSKLHLRLENFFHRLFEMASFESSYFHRLSITMCFDFSIISPMTNILAAKYKLMYWCVLSSILNQCLHLFCF